MSSVSVCYIRILCFFFFKQKTAYEMRISDWSSDVCSSDLPRGYAALRAAAERDPLIEWDTHPLEGFESTPIASLCARYDLVVLDHPQIGRASCRERVCQYV